VFLDDLPICVERDRCIDMPEFFLWTLKLAETIEQVCPHAAPSVCTVPSPGIPWPVPCGPREHSASAPPLLSVLPALA